jgi:hypothetical protein
MATDRHTVDAGDTLYSSRDRQVSFRWPLAIDQRLDALVQRATTAGERTNRRELLAALILTCNLSGDELGSMLRKYRTADVSAAVLDLTITADNVVSFAQHRPGPRVSRS